MGSLSYLGNFDVNEYKEVIDAIVMQENSFHALALDLRSQLSV